VSAAGAELAQCAGATDLAQHGSTPMEGVPKFGAVYWKGAGWAENLQVFVFG